MTLPDNDAFCVLPWVHLCGGVDGVWGRCCVDASMYHDELYQRPERPTFALHPDALGCLPASDYAADNPDRVAGVAEAFNSPNMRRTRLKMLAGEKVEACSYCYTRERTGGESYRQKAPDMLSPDTDVAALVAATAADGSVAGFPPFLDLRFGNTCNLSCIMCGYPVSSKWGLESHPSWAPAHIDPYRDDEDLWRQLREHAGTLRRVYFAGGEPFLQAGHFRLVDLLIETGAAGRIHLAYHSNLTVLPDGIFDKLDRFGSVEIGASCDGTGEVFERIRRGARWEAFAANVRTARQRLDVWLSVAPQRDNVFHLRDVIDFAVAEGIATDLSNFVHWPEELCVRSLPDGERRAAVGYLTDLIGHCAGLGLEKEARHLGMLREFVRPESDGPGAAG